MRRWKIVAAITSCSAAILACQVVIGLEKPVGVDPPVVEAGTADQCRHAVPPSRPTGSDTKQLAPRWLAVERYQIPYRDDAGVGTGLDLDNSCTCNPDPSYRDPTDGAPSCVSSLDSVTCDGDGGVDDAFGNALGGYFGSFTAYDPRDVGNQDILKGYRTMMVWVSGYNGADDDDKVSVALVPSNGIHTAKGGCGTSDPRPVPDATVNESPTPYYPPLFDGCDSWTMSPTDAVLPASGGALLPLDIVTDAYVKGRVLVASYKQAPFSLAGAIVTANAVRLVARITPIADDRFTLDGFITGRLPGNALVAAASRLEATTPDGSASFCDESVFPQFVKLLCGALDIRGSDDNRALPCDGISVVLGIHAATAQADPQTAAVDVPSFPCANGTVPTCP